VEVDVLEVGRDRLEALAGRTVIHVHSLEQPGEGFEPVAPDLEDVYFHTLRESSAPAAQAAA